ncbi:MAG: hypothetical protein AMXMBFR7_00430 [Planctomycetota bacterium]
MTLTFCSMQRNPIRKAAPAYCRSCKRTVQAVRASARDTLRCRVCGGGVIVSRMVARSLGLLTF